MLSVYASLKFCLLVIRLCVYSIDTHFEHQKQTFLKNIAGKREIACNKQFLLFPQCLVLNQVILSQLVHIFDIISFTIGCPDVTNISISSSGGFQPLRCLSWFGFRCSFVLKSFFLSMYKIFDCCWIFVKCVCVIISSIA